MAFRALSRVAGRQRQFRVGRSFSSALSEHDSDVTIQHSPITRFTEDEEMTRDMARQWADQELKPIVREMDDEAKLRPEILESLFQCGFMGMVRVSLNNRDPAFIHYALIPNTTCYYYNVGNSRRVRWIEHVLYVGLPCH